MTSVFKSLNIDVDPLTIQSGHQQDVLADLVLQFVAKLDDIDPLFHLDVYRQRQFVFFVHLCFYESFIFFSRINILRIFAYDRCDIFKSFIAYHVSADVLVFFFHTKIISLFLVL